MSKIEDLWANEEVPIDNALHFADGRSYDVCVDPDSPSGMSVQDEFDLEERLAIAPDWVSVVDGRKIDLEDGGALWHGDGDNGSEGFIARVKKDGSLDWVVFFTASNPFTEAEVHDGQATFRSTAGVTITVDIDDPRRPVVG